VKPRHFKSAADFREWLASNGPRARELWVGFYKKASGKGGLTYKEAVDEALCHGWIDGIKKRVDEDSYTHRFTPRTATSIWSVVNLKRMQELLASGRVAAAGRDVYERRDRARTHRYSYEKAPATFEGVLERRFKANKAAWTYFQAQPTGYRNLVTKWVTGAVKEETRLRRLDMVIRDSAEGKRISWM